MTQEELIDVFKYIVKKCDMLINNGDYEADAYTQDTVEDIGELCNHILDGDYGKLVEAKEAQEEPVSEPNKELAKTYLDVFDKKFPILPTLKGKELADYKNFLNKCQQIFGLKHWGIYPTQAKLFEKLSLLWAVWGAEHLHELGKYNKEEQDTNVSKDLEKAAIEAFKQIVDTDKNNFLEIFKAGANWQKEQEIKCKHRTFLQGEKSVANYILKMIDNGWHINAIYTVCKDKLKED